MRALKWLMLGAGGVGALIVSSSAAARAPNARDVTAARRLIAAETRFDRAFLAHRAAITSAGKRYAAMIKSRCAGSLPESVLVSGTPRQTGVFKDLVREAGFDLYLADTQSVASAERRFANALNRVHFTRLSLIIAVG